MNILLIGATSAVAQAFARNYAQRGASLYCIARTVEKMNTLAEELGAACIGHTCYDFLDTNRTKTVVLDAIQTLGQVDLVLIAHGYLPNQHDTEIDFTRAEQTFQINCLSVIAFLNALYDQLGPQMKSKIGVITSVAGDRGRPRNFTYGAAKGALSLYMQGLRSKHWSGCIELYNFKLGPTDTPMTIDHEKNGTFTTPEIASKLMIKAFKAKRYEVYVPGFWRWIMLCVRLMPEWLFQRLKFLSGP